MLLPSNNSIINKISYFNFDPNILFAKIGGDILVTGSSTLQNFTAVNSTTTNATTTSLFSRSVSVGIGSTPALTINNSSNILYSAVGAYHNFYVNGG